ncbi:hypothetical protein BB560_005950 [Smittium megazygosporum]|uniref:MI domain-containing protein n=1 Tax=Smittium megazygosporum TaxID=133381 RepID=A0A2T9YPP1_9FUNG|nr:hypothetical protein BB560_005950 [Smittium megazygosporum]
MKQTMRQNAEVVQPLKKFLSNLSRKSSIVAPEPINVNLDDIRNVETKGKWWLVGSYWAGSEKNTNKSSLSSIKQQSDPSDIANDSAYNELLLLSKAFRMNTDIRRTIFMQIMSSQDAVEAFEKCMKLGLKESQQREIIRVLLLLVAQIID